MDAVGRMIKRDRKDKYKLLRKFRKARDIAAKHTHRKYTCNFLRRQIKKHDEFSWFALNSKNELARAIYRWSERERNMFGK